MVRGLTPTPPPAEPHDTTALVEAIARLAEAVETLTVLLHDQASQKPKRKKSKKRATASEDLSQAEIDHMRWIDGEHL